MSIKNKKVLIAFYDSFHTCPRPKRLFTYLSKHNEVDILSKDFHPFPEINHFFVLKRSVSKLMQYFLRILVRFHLVGIAARIEEKRIFSNLPPGCLREYDYIFVHDISLLCLFKHCPQPIVYDAREFYPLMFAEDASFRAYDAPIYDYWCRTLVPRFPCKITVSELVVKKYQEVYGAQFYNFPSFPLRSFLEKAGETGIKTSDGCSKIRLIYHGAAHKDRNIEKLIELGTYLSPGIELHLMLKPYDRGYFKALKSLVEKTSSVTLLPPVAFEDIIPFIADYDIGIHLLENQENQHAISLPNKFFEYLGAGLMLVTAGSKEMYNYVQKFNLGVAFDTEVDLKILAETINKLDRVQVTKFRKHNKKCAEKFVFERAAPALFEYIDSLRNS